jgi:hypothetical protein
LVPHPRSYSKGEDKVNDETRGRVLNGAAVREQTEKGATTAGRVVTASITPV